MAVEQKTNESISNIDKSANDAEQQSGQVSIGEVESGSATDHIEGAQYQNKSETFAENRKVINQGTQHDTCDNITKSNSNIETQKIDPLPSKERRYDVQVSIKKLGDDKKEAVTDREVFLRCTE